MTHFKDAHAMPSFFTVCLFCVIGTSAYAQNEQTIEVENKEVNWSTGVGIGIPGSSFALNGTLLIAPSFALSTTPDISLGFERRLSSKNWLLFQLVGSYARAEGQLESDVSQSTRANVDVGIRHNFTPNGVVEVSGIATANFGYYRAFSHASGNNPIDPSAPLILNSYLRGWSVGATAGIAVERKLIEQLALRLSTPLVTGRYADAINQFNGIVGSIPYSSHGFMVDLQFAPQLELRYFF